MADDCRRGGGHETGWPGQGDEAGSLRAVRGQRCRTRLTFVIRSKLETDAVISGGTTGCPPRRPRSAARRADDARRSGRGTRPASNGSGPRCSLAFAAVTLFLAALGIYGVLAYFVSQRARELGIRLALGARPRALFLMVVGQGMRPVAAGTGIGLAAAAALTGLMKSMLFGIEPARSDDLRGDGSGVGDDCRRGMRAAGAARHPRRPAHRAA